MKTQFRKIGSDTAITAGQEVEIKPIRTGAVLNEPSTNAAETSPVSRRPYITLGCNSRTGTALKKGKWMMRFAVAVDPNLKPAHILHGADRILIQGEGPWQLFDSMGRALAAGYAHNSELYLAPEAGLFVYSNDSGMIVAHGLKDGRRRYVAPLYFGGAFYRTFIFIDDQYLLAASVEQEIDQDNEEKPYRSMIERCQLSKPEKIDADGVLRSLKSVGRLKQESLALIAAAEDGKLVTATDGRINVFRGNLDLETSMVGEFNPVAMSLGTNDNIFMVVADGEAYKLRAINGQGQRLFSVLLPYTAEYQNYPPIISYDHDVFILAGNNLLAIDRNGYPTWEYKSDHHIAGAVVTPENDLIIASGPEVGVFDASGNYRLLYEFQNETVKAPPALTEKGEILVATGEKLYCLATSEIQ